MTGAHPIYLTLDEWVHLAAETLKIDPATIRNSANLTLADSALHAPAAGFGGHDAYPDLIEKAAVLGWHLTNNHALPDGNKRIAFIAMIVFLARNGHLWTPPSVEDAVTKMIAVADKTLDTAGLTAWLRIHTT